MEGVSKGLHLSNYCDSNLCEKCYNLQKSNLWLAKLGNWTLHIMTSIFCCVLVIFQRGLKIELKVSIEVNSCGSYQITYSTIKFRSPIRFGIVPLMLQLRKLLHHMRKAYCFSFHHFLFTSWVYMYLKHIFCSMQHLRVSEPVFSNQMPYSFA